MKTKLIPAIVALVAGFVFCLLAFSIQMSMVRFIEIFCVVMIGFYLLGWIIKILVDSSFMLGETMECEEKEELGDIGEVQEETQEAFNISEDSTNESS
jgi:hypothetical protein